MLVVQAYFYRIQFTDLSTWTNATIVDGFLAQDDITADYTDTDFGSNEYTFNITSSFEPLDDTTQTGFNWIQTVNSVEGPDGAVPLEDVLVQRMDDISVDIAGLNSDLSTIDPDLMDATTYRTDHLEAATITVSENDGSTTTDILTDTSLAQSDGTASNAEEALTILGNALDDLSGYTWDGSVDTSGTDPTITVEHDTTNNYEVAITRNNGSNITESVTNNAGTAAVGQASTYTLTDYSGTFVVSRTFSVSSTSESDLDDILDWAEGQIDSNTETPVDFTAAINASDVLVLTAGTTGSVDGMWTLTANHHGQTTDAGDLSFATTIETEGGTDTPAEEAEVTRTTPDGVEQTFTITGPKTTAQALASIILETDDVDGWTESGSGTTLTYEATSVGNRSGTFSFEDANGHLTFTATSVTEGT